MTITLSGFYMCIQKLNVKHTPRLACVGVSIVTRNLVTYPALINCSENVVSCCTVEPELTVTCINQFSDLYRSARKVPNGSMHYRITA